MAAVRPFEIVCTKKLTSLTWLSNFAKSKLDLMDGNFFLDSRYQTLVHSLTLKALRFRIFLFD